MLKTVTAAVLAAGVAFSGAAQDALPEDMGEYRISVYCQYCNEEVGFVSASGKQLEYGDVAMNGVPLGTRISIGGEEFTVTDRVGVANTVDIFIPSDDGRCHCNTLEYKEVYRIADEDMDGSD